VQDLGVARACPVAALVDPVVTNPGVRCGTGATRLVFSKSEPGVTGCSLGVAWVWAGGVGGVPG